MEGKKLDFNAPFLSVRANRKIREAPLSVMHHSLHSQKSDWELTVVAKLAAVPFDWEQTPGRPRDGSTTHSPSPEESSVTPMFPPGRTFDNKKCVSGEQFENRTLSRPHVEAYPMNENVEDSNINNISAGSSSENEAYSDGHDPLLESELISWNCSVSGLSGYDDPYARPSRTFTVNPQTREIMMTRFLPAARAMAVETERKKQPLASELPRHFKKVLSGELRPLFEKYGSNTALHQSQYKGSVASEDEDDKCMNRGTKSIKSCGFLPRLCAKNSLCFLDPVPGTKSRAQCPISSGPEFRRMARTVYSGRLPQTRHEKKDRNDIYWKNNRSKVQSQEPVGCIFPFRNEKPQPSFYYGARFLDIPKIVKDNEANKFCSIDGVSDELDVSVHQIYTQGLGSFIALAEKTLHIDPLYNTEVPNLDLVLSKLKGVDNLSKPILGERKRVEGFPTPKSFTPGKKIVNPKTVGSLDEDLHSYRHIYNLKVQAHSNERVNHEQNIDQEPRNTSCLVLYTKDTLDKNEDTENSSVGTLKSPKPPPLPKSPSESWLWRTLPSVSLRNPFSHDQPKRQDQRTSTTAAKWETIVKASHVHHQHLRHTEELISHVHQPPKT